VGIPPKNNIRSRLVPEDRGYFEVGGLGGGSLKGCFSLGADLFDSWGRDMPSCYYWGELAVGFVVSASGDQGVSAISGYITMLGLRDADTDEWIYL
jgi:hypothetical protein